MNETELARMSFIHFSVAALDLIDKLPHKATKKRWIEFIYRHQISDDTNGTNILVNGLENNGFRRWFAYSPSPVINHH